MRDVRAVPFVLVIGLGTITALAGMVRTRRIRRVDKPTE
jgi:hypothetical protein